MKSMIYLVVGLLLISGFAAVSIGEEASVQQNTVSITFLQPKVEEKDNFVQLQIEGADSWVFDPGSPLVPVKTKTIYLPFGATINDIQCTAQNIQTMVLSKKVEPAPQPVVLSNEVKASSEPSMDLSIYESDQMYPNNWFSYNMGVGLDKNNEHTTILTISTYPIRYNPVEDTIYYAQKIDVTYSYKMPDSTPFRTSAEEYKLVIIAPPKFKSAIQPLVTHKISKGITTLLKSTEDIYDEYDGYDAPEDIKLFIKYAIENYSTTYVILCGGLKSWINAIPRDNKNEGTVDWHVPVRYSNMLVQAGDDPGYITDLYYADIYKEGGLFDNWDSNGNHIFAENKGLNRDHLDLYPDVAVGRLCCRTTKEVKAVVDKIITYETTTIDPTWFEKIIAVSGDGFMDQIPLGITWNTNGLPNGEYTIYAQSKNNTNNIYGPIDEIQVTLDSTKATSLHFNHDDNLITGLKYPFPPVAEIVTVSDGDTLGNTDYSYAPKEWEAYCNDITGWANMQFNNGYLKIGGKTYDPKPYGVGTDIHVWVNNSGGSTVYNVVKTGFEMYWEGEWCTGEELLLGRAGGLYYMPSTYEKVKLWASNGAWTSQKDVLNEFNKGAGFIFFSGHGSPAVWADQYPGIPGNRNKGSIDGLFVFNWEWPNGIPLFPMGSLSNNYKNPVVVVGGCHNSDFNVSLIPSFKDKNNSLSTHCYGIPTPECWSERLVNVGKGGAIATIGNTGYGYGLLSRYCTAGGLDGYITTEFFLQYGTNGYNMLGQTYSQTITEYINHFKTNPDFPWDDSHQKTVEQWILIGDPSLKLGGYS